MKRRLIFGSLIVALLVNLAFGAKIYLKSSRAADQRDAATANLEIFSDVLDRIRSDYVDETNTAYQPLIYAAIKGMVSKLDPHSEFLDPEANQELQDETEGQFGGLGLVVAMKGGYVTVVSPMEDTPASRAGILTGDRMVKVAGNSVEKMALDDVVKQLRGDPDTTVSVTFERPSSGATKTYSLKRAIIQMDMAKDINDQKKFPLDENKIGYVRLTQFSEKAGDELEDALQKMKAQGMRGLILDLRWNPGGLLDQAVEVCQKFLPRGQLVVSTEGRHVVEKYFAKGSGDELKGIPIVVLVNLGSASAAEIVTGCLQDLHRAYVIGEKTFGKGSVQTIFPLDDGSALKLTVAKYYTPSHKVIHEHGITPDSLVPMTDAQEAAVLLKRAPGGMESLSENDRARVESFRDDQLDRAEDLLKAMILFNSADAAKN
jgi:carboxyl-terminal processing protease